MTAPRRQSIQRDRQLSDPLNLQRHAVSVRYLLFYLIHLARHGLCRVPQPSRPRPGLVSRQTYSFQLGPAFEDFFLTDRTLEFPKSLTRSSGFTRAFSTVSPQ
jgi:hypothetical protein